MMRSMFSGVSSLKAHQLRMDVIGNNIANVNTVGYKASSVSFAEMYSQTLKGAGSSDSSRGGTNPMQVGLGATVSSISVNHTKGSIQRTDIATDLMVDGAGFFMVTDDPNAQNKYFTRAGNFNMDESGYLVTNDGLRVLDKSFKPIQVNMSDTKMATISDKILLNGNINFEDEDYNTTVDVYDSLGAVHTLNINFMNDPIPAVKTLTNAAPNTIALNDPENYNPDGTVNVQPHSYSYRKMNITDSSNTQLIPAATDDLYALFNQNGEVVDVVGFPIGTDPTLVASVDASYNSTVVMAVPGAENISLPVNRAMFFANGDVTGSRIFFQYSQESDARGIQLNGNSAGTINSFNISSKGEVVGVYTNGERKTLQVIGLANFDNPSGLMKMGSNLFQETANSGVAKYGTPSSGSFGSLTPGALEMSNVDLAAQFTDMITTQRGFQANSRVITTSDEILQELVNLKR